MSIIGIDFGSNAIVIGTALGMSGTPGRGGIDVVLNGNSQRRTPNIVSFVDKERFMGEQAEPYVRSKVTNTVSSLNRILGHNFSETFTQNEIARLPYKIVKLDDDKVGIEVQYNDETKLFSPEQLTAMIISHCSEIAQKASNNYAKPDVVVSVPSYWTDAQRRAIKNACIIADVSCLGIVNSSTATCIDYGIFRNLKGVFNAEKPSNVMFYDMGYSDTVCAIVSYFAGKFVIQSVAYDVNLGGRNVDDLIINKVSNEFMAKYHVDPRTNKKSMIKLQAAAEKAKKTLSPQGVDRSPLSIECLSGDYDYSSMLLLSDLQQMIVDAHLPERAQNVIQDALNQCGFTPKDIEMIEICGGGVRVPLIKRAIAEFMQTNLEAPNFGLSTTLNMDETVGRGAAIRCAILSPRIRVKDVIIEDRNLYNIGISINGEEQMLFPRGCSFPQEKILTLPGYNTYVIGVHYTENNSLDANADKRICNIIIDQDDHMKEEGAVMTLSISMDAEGCIKYNYTNVTVPQPDIAVEKIIKKPATPATPTTPVEGDKKEEKPSTPVMVEEKITEMQHVAPKIYTMNAKVSYNTTDASDVENCKKVEEDMKTFDRKLRETKHAKNELESFVYNIRDKFYGTFDDYILEEERKTIMNALEEEENWVYSYEGGNSTKETYINRLDVLHKLTHDVMFRYSEDQQRNEVLANWKKVMDWCDSILGSKDEKYSHITPEDREPLVKEVNELKNWFKSTYDTQLTLNKYENPVLLNDDLKTKGNAIFVKINTLFSKPKPKPVEKKEEKATTPKEEKAATPKEDKMDVDEDKPSTETPESSTPAQDDKMEVEH